MALTEKGKKLVQRLVVLLVLIAVGGGVYYAKEAGFGRVFKSAFSGEQVALDTTDTFGQSQVQAEFVALPSTSPWTPPTNAPRFEAYWLGWNSQIGCILANGGKTTTRGSILQKKGVHLTITREDNPANMLAALERYARVIKDNGVRGQPIVIVSLMTDGSGTITEQWREHLRNEVGEEYAEVVDFYSCGRSYGEDQLMGPPEWADNPDLMKGEAVVTYVGDGDFWVAVNYALGRNIPINPDVETWDLGALNFIHAPDGNVQAGQMFNANVCETRPVVRTVNGKVEQTGEQREICAKAASVWTPVDVAVARGRGGVVRLASTREFPNQMPNSQWTLKIAIDSVPAAFDSLVAGFAAGGEQVRAHEEALDHAAALSATVWGEQNQKFWKDLYTGITEKATVNGQTYDVRLGGSQAFTLADNLLLFGQVDGESIENSRAAATYNQFARFGIRMGLVTGVTEAEITPPAEAFDVRSIRNVARAQGVTGQQAAEQTFVAQQGADGAPATPLSERNVSIEFTPGSAVLTPAGQRTVRELAEELRLSEERITLHGYTDNTGTADPEVRRQRNLALSEERAMAVRDFLVSEARFPARRITVEAHGESNPVAPNSTAAGRAQNRRVQVVVGG